MPQLVVKCDFMSYLLRWLMGTMDAWEFCMELIAWAFDGHLINPSDQARHWTDENAILHYGLTFSRIARSIYVAVVAYIVVCEVHALLIDQLVAGLRYFSW